MSKHWIVGWGDGLTGPTTAATMPFCGGEKWEFLPISYGSKTIALVPSQGGENGELLMQKHAKLIAAAPDLLESLQALMCDHGGSRAVSSDDERAISARAAIKKAT